MTAQFPSSLLITMATPLTCLENHPQLSDKCTNYVCCRDRFRPVEPRLDGVKHKGVSCQDDRLQALVRSFIVFAHFDRRTESWVAPERSRRKICCAEDDGIDGNIFSSGWRLAVPLHRQTSGGGWLTFILNQQIPVADRNSFCVLHGPARSRRRQRVPFPTSFLQQRHQQRQKTGHRCLPGSGGGSTGRRSCNSNVCL